jgi:hypothetical protein
MKKKKAKRTITTYLSVTLNRAIQAVKAYNEECYSRVKNPDLDKRAHEKFTKGLGSTITEIEDQVTFIGDDYGGVAGRPAAIKLAPAIACAIFKNRYAYAQTANTASPILVQPPSQDATKILFDPFVQPLVDKNGRETKNWLVWATKFWHHLNPPTFPIEDGRVDDFFVLKTYTSPVDRYTRLSNRFRDFVISHHEWLPHLRDADGGIDGEVDGKPVCSDNKLGTRCSTASVI